MMMPVAARTDAFTAFQSQLRTLCLNEFPCGTGSWRKSTEKNIPDTRFSVTLKDYGASKEQEEALEEFVTSKFSPYSVDYSWSDEAKGLRELAVKSPWLISDDFIHKHFKTLRIVDKHVQQLDSGLLRLPNLEELTVTANHLTTVHSHNIPKTVKVLELVANQINDLEQLCEDPPPELQHLGLGLNKISAIHDYITGAYWPCLLSLDLSHNNLCDLIEVINKLSTLPKLRNLVLLGNPLALIPGYRGFTIDSLRKLDILDDLRISADEKHHFTGLGRRKEYVLDEAKVTVKITAASGIPQPPELLTTEDVPQYPITTRTYYVEFMFLEDFQAKAKAEEEKKKAAEKEEKDKEQEKDSVANGNKGGDGDKGEGDKEKDVKAEEPALLTTTTCSRPPSQPTDNPPDRTPGPNPSQTPPPPLKLVPYRTKGIRWSEEGFKYEFTQDLVIDDLPALKEYFKRGMDLSIKEDRVLSTPAESNENGEEKKKDKGDEEDDFFQSRSTSRAQGGRNTAASRMGNTGSRMGPSRMGNNASRMGPSRMGKANNAPRMGASRMGKAPAPRMGASRMGKAPAPAPRMGASRMGKAPAPRTGASRMGASRMGNAATGVVNRGAPSRLRLGNNMRSQSKMSSRLGELPEWPPPPAGDKKKKKKEPEIELVHSPPDVTILGTYTLALAEFIEGEYVVDKTCTCKGKEETGNAKEGEEEGTKEEEDGKDSQKDKKKKKDGSESSKGKKGKGDGKDSKEGKDKDKDKDKAKEGKKAATKPDKKDSKTKVPGSGKDEEEEEEKPPPPPLTVTISVELQHWKTAQESIPKQSLADKMALIQEAIVE